MKPRWFSSLATLVASAGITVAQAPVPAGDPAPSPPAPTTVAVPTLLNGQPAPAALVSMQKERQVMPVALDTPVPETAPTVAPPALDASAPANAVLPLRRDPDRTPPRFWGRSEYLLWRVKETPLRTLIGTIPDYLGSQGTLPPGAIIPVYGGDKLSYGTQNGVRLNVGASLDEAGVWGVETEFFQLEHAANGTSTGSGNNGSPTLGPVFDDPVTGRQTIILYSTPLDPRAAVTSLDAKLESRLWGAEINARRQITAIFADRVDFLVGYRHVSFDESLETNGTSTQIASTPSAFAVVSYSDRFGVHNTFDGAQVGLESEYNIGRFFLDFRGKFGMGNVHESYNINGSTSFTSTDPTMASQKFVGGVLAQPTNSGRFEHDKFSFLGEVTVNGGVRFGEHVKAFVGYSFLGLSKVARVNGLIDGVDGTTVPSLQGSARNALATQPTQKVDDGRFWAQGLNLGLQFDF